jgi:ATP phosphoribosyltransferase regulatory subunit
MLTQDRWLLPEGIEEIFPDEAEHLDQLGRTLIDQFHAWGYRLVMPPMVDFLDSLLTGSGYELDQQTLKFVDPLTGRLVGLRADMTPQVARIDARTAASGLPSRLCYLGNVIHGVGAHLEKTRNPIQVGAELYGHSGGKATAEVIRLMLETLHAAGIREVHLDLGHVGIYRALAQEAGLSEADEASLFDILQRKDATDLNQFLAEKAIRPEIRPLMKALLDLNGPLEILDEARRRLADGGEQILAALGELADLGAELKRRYPGLPLHLDLAELRGYQYHTGIVFAAFVPGQGREIARGGRYDDIGKVFGFARPAVGFSADLKFLARLGAASGRAVARRIFAPATDDPALEQQVAALRAEGRVVIQSLGHADETAGPLGCTESLILKDGRWILV